MRYRVYAIEGVFDLWEKLATYKGSQVGYLNRKTHGKFQALSAEKEMARESEEFLSLYAKM